MKHQKDVLEQELAIIDVHLDAPVTAYLIGGGAMSFHGLKEATKDIDCILGSRGDLQTLVAALEASGYRRQTRLDPAYQRLGATTIYAKDGAPQWDLHKVPEHRDMCLREV